VDDDDALLAESGVAAPDGVAASPAGTTATAAPGGRTAGQARTASNAGEDEARDFFDKRGE
jgi:hypothetical protein